MTRPKEDDGAPGTWIEDRTVTTTGDELDAVYALLRRPAWHAHAACRGQGTDAWFPTQGESLGPALAVCAECPVREPCAEVGLGERDGVWGGLSGMARRPLRSADLAERRAAADARRATRAARSAEILRRLAAGEPADAVAESLGVSLRTVTGTLALLRSTSRAG